MLHAINLKTWTVGWIVERGRSFFSPSHILPSKQQRPTTMLNLKRDVENLLLPGEVNHTFGAMYLYI